MNIREARRHTFDRNKGAGAANRLLMQGVDPLTITDNTSIKRGDVFECYAIDPVLENGEVNVGFRANQDDVPWILRVPLGSLPPRTRRRRPQMGDTVRETQGTRHREGTVFGVDRDDAAVRWRDGGATVLNVSRLEIV